MATVTAAATPPAEVKASRASSSIQLHPHISWSSSQPSVERASDERRCVYVHITRLLLLLLSAAAATSFVSFDALLQHIDVFTLRTPTKKKHSGRGEAHFNYRINSGRRRRRRGGGEGNDATAEIKLRFFITKMRLCWLVVAVVVVMIREKRETIVICLIRLMMTFLIGVVVVVARASGPRLFPSAASTAADAEMIQSLTRRREEK